MFQILVVVFTVFILLQNIICLTFHITIFLKDGANQSLHSLYMHVYDMIMSVPLFIIYKYDNIMQEQYVLQRYEWTHGVECKAVGIIILFCYEASNLTRFGLSVKAFITINYPFMAQEYLETKSFQ